METEAPNGKRRNPWLAGIASYFFPPLGHVYAGAPGRGLLLLVGVTAIWAAALWTAARSVSIAQLERAYLLAFTGNLWMAADAAVAARQRGSAPLRRYQRWQFYLGTIAFAFGFAVMAVFCVIRPFVVQAYYIPSGAMIPTLAIEDRILVDKLTYRWRNPTRGEVVVFHAPPQASPEENVFVKRVIGLPGETVAVVPDTLLVDGKPAVVINDDPGTTNSDFQHTRQRGLRWVDKEHSPRVQGNMLSVNGEPRVAVTPSGRAERRSGRIWVGGEPVADTDNAAGLRIVEDLGPFGAAPGVEGSVYYLPQSEQPALIVLKGRRLTLRPGWVSINGRPLTERYVYQSPRYEMAPYRIPSGQYFVMGDNRNDSNDSHAWGPLARNRIFGVAHMIYLSPQQERIGRPL